jgi:hypothetical protein
LAAIRENIALVGALYDENSRARYYPRKELHSMGEGTTLSIHRYGREGGSPMCEFPTRILGSDKHRATHIPMLIANIRYLCRIAKYGRLELGGRPIKPFAVGRDLCEG